MIAAFLRTLNNWLGGTAVPSWTDADERDLADRRARHERTADRARAKSDAVHDALARRVWGSRANGWRGSASR